MYVYIYICVYPCLYTYGYIHIYMYICEYIYMFLYMNIYIHMNTYKYVHIYIATWTDLHEVHSKGHGTGDIIRAYPGQCGYLGRTGGLESDSHPSGIDIEHLWVQLRVNG
jgi:hypothetical protein